MVFLQDELDLVRIYLDLENLRFDNKFEVIFEMDDVIEMAERIDC